MVDGIQRITIDIMPVLRRHVMSFPHPRHPTPVISFIKERIDTTLENCPRTIRQARDEAVDNLRCVRRNVFRDSSSSEDRDCQCIETDLDLPCRDSGWNDWAGRSHEAITTFSRQVNFLQDGTHPIASRYFYKLLIINNLPKDILRLGMLKSTQIQTLFFTTR